MSPSLTRPSLVCAALAGVLATGCMPSSEPDAEEARPSAVTPEQLSTVVRWNASDDDSQVWLTAVDGDLAMATITVRTPEGEAIFTERLDDAGGHGQERLEYRSSEHSLAELEAIYPAGEYRWTGRTADGERIRGTTEVSYELPDAPTIVAPADEAADVPVDGVVMQWSPVADAQWIFVEVEADGDGRELLIRLEGSATSLALPDGYLQPGTDYEVELKAVHTNGNQAARDSVFSTRARPG
jgi:hypothetical protein